MTGKALAPLKRNNQADFVNEESTEGEEDEDEEVEGENDTTFFQPSTGTQDTALPGPSDAPTPPYDVFPSKYVSFKTFNS